MTKIGGKGGGGGMTCVGIVVKVCHRTLFAQTKYTGIYHTVVLYWRGTGSYIFKYWGVLTPAPLRTQVCIKQMYCEIHLPLAYVVIVESFLWRN